MKDNLLCERNPNELYLDFKECYHTKNYPKLCICCGKEGTICEIKVIDCVKYLCNRCYTKMYTVGTLDHILNPSTNHIILKIT